VRVTHLGRALPAVIVVAVLAGLYGLAGLHHSVSLAAGPPARPPHAVGVTAVQRACPAPGASSSPGSGVAMMAAAGTGPGAANAAGSAVVSRLSSAQAGMPGTRVLSVTEPGTPRFAQVSTDRAQPAGTRRQRGGKTKPGQPSPGAAGPGAGPAITTTVVSGGVVVAADGRLAQGLDVEQTAGTGLPTAACASPGTSFWFAGPGQHAAGHIQLYLMNTGSQPADASVAMFTDAGPVQGATDSGITVPPHGMVVQSLASVLRHSRSITLHVQASVGQVAAAVQESTGTGPGTWLPAAQPPGTHLLVPGLPAAAGTRQLFIAVPGVKDASVHVTAVTPRGSYVPTGASGIDLPGGSAAEVSLPSLSGIPAALQLTATAPVTAEVLIPGGGGSSPGPVTAATPALDEQGVVADNPSGAGRVSALVLSAPHQAARVSVTQIAAGGASRPPAQQVPVPAGKSVVVPLHPVPGAPKGTPFAVVITPLAGSGPVYAGRVISGAGAGGAVQAMLPVASALITVPLPAVHSATISAAR
jgi:Family of unknown function (DUF5719)